MTEKHPDKIRVLFICTNNSARSQMAEGLINHDLGGRFQAQSAGTQPTVVRPQAVRVLAELGIDISAARSKSLDEFTGRSFDHVITLCDGAAGACPVFLGGGRQVHLGFDDPAAAVGDDDAILDEFRRVRDLIRHRVEAYLLNPSDQAPES